MITHERLVEEVAAKARLSGRPEAGRVVRVALAALTHRLQPPQRRRLREALPAPERDAAYAVVPPPEDGLPALDREVGRNLHTGPERARFLARTVVSEIAGSDARLARELREALPDEYGELFDPPPGMPPRSAAAPTVPQALGPQELAAELRRRPLWSGDTRRITREVLLPAERIQPLLARVGRAARELHHHPGYEQRADGIVFALRTRSADGVTALDLALADAIDAAAAAGPSGTPG